MRKVMSTTAALLAAAAMPFASAFTCTWRGGDYSWFTYIQDIPPYCCIAGASACPDGWDFSKFCGDNFYESCNSCGNNGGAYCCEDPYSKQYVIETRTQCCQCEGDQVFNPFVEPFPNGQSDYFLSSGDCAASPDYIGAIQGCDGFAPEIQYSDAAAQVRSPGLWFTSAAQLDTYLEQTITCADDCWEMGDVFKDSDTNDDGPWCRYTWAAGCANTVVTANAKDRCGNFYSKAITVRFDDSAPDVTVTLGNFTPGKYKYPYEQVPLTVTVQDDCDPNPLTSIEVFSDEAPLVGKYEPSAVLGRLYAGPGVSTDADLNGWRLTLSRKFATSSSMEKAFTTPMVDGRVYTVRVCAQDLAGNVGCAEKYVEVPTKVGSPAKVIPKPINNGKLYSVASDLVYFNAPQTDIPFRLQNTGLTTYGR